MKTIEERRKAHAVQNMVENALFYLSKDLCREFDISGDISPQLNKRLDDCCIELKIILTQFVIDNLKKS